MSFSLIITLLLVLVIVGAFVILLSDEGDGGRKLLWLITIILLPFAGLVLYLIFGLNFRNRRYFEHKHKPFADWISKSSRAWRILRGDDSGVEQRFRSFARLLKGKLLPGVSGGNDVEIITEGPRKLEALLEDIENATEYIHFQYYLFGDDVSGRAVKEALMRKASQGIKVRLLHENVANYDTKRSFYNQMRKSGVEVVRTYNPKFRLLRLITRLNYRNHRKIVIIDGRIGYTGGMNIKDRYFTKWRDTHLRIIGPAVSQLQYIFLDSWITSGGMPDKEPDYYFPEEFHKPQDSEKAARRMLKNKLVQVTPDEPDTQYPVIELGYIWTITNAKDYIWLQTPYFIPPPSVLAALKAAALSGVDVRVMVPQESENFFIGPAVRSYYKECLAVGIRIYERGGGFIHSKTFVVDDYLSSVGSANIDNRSLNINYEVNTYLYDKEAALESKAIFLKDLKLSTEILPKDISHLSFGRRFGQKVIRLFASQL